MTIQKLLDSSGNSFYPVCHTDAIKVKDEIVNLTQYLTDIIGGLSDFAQILGYRMIQGNGQNGKITFQFTKENNG